MTAQPGSLPHVDSEYYCYRCYRCYRCYLLLRQLGISKEEAIKAARECWEHAA